MIFLHLIFWLIIIFGSIISIFGLINIVSSIIDGYDYTKNDEVNNDRIITRKNKFNI